ncbi:hypothetical protein [Deinococcus maricopensis]|uniref:Conserved repeat domain protein n=1 Tax=Deinococcus maricopensis (strain DSM 21211 / LMG 22137 / NRRL B-23946 / LB-34) TaxID=709986 RepID=E8UBZ6_DEIML|nr:hypothetical protein [Deinococcus maricopensis]ADV68585.1 conserved repeat domain protein [Deinococcus maricopensis DSM 21211]
MNRTRTLALMVALAAAQALAAGTPAGTTITNTATATFTDPANPGGPSGTATSNTVQATVLPRPDFTVTPNDLGTPGQPDQDAPIPQYDRVGVLPGSQQAFGYTVTNTGNTPVLVDLRTLNRTDTTVQAPTYYLDVNADGLFTPGTDTPLTDTDGNGVPDTGLLQPDQTVRILQVYTVPANATPGTFFGASPNASGQYDPNFTPGGTATPTTPIPNPTTGTGLLTDADNFNRVLVFTPTASVDPVDADPATPGQQDPTPPNPATPPTYTDPNPLVPAAPTRIEVIGDEQNAYPPADPDTANDRVTFLNSVTNGSAQTDSFNLLPPTNLPAGVTVTFLDEAGNPLPIVNGFPVLQNVAPGQTVNFRVVVTYPDTDTPTAITSPALPIVVTVGVDSTSDADTTPEDTAIDRVFPPALSFGDATPALGTSPQPIVDQITVPGAPGTLQPGDITDSQGIYPMDLANLGGYPESYRLTGTVTVPLVGGGSTPVSVQYYLDTNGDGAPDTLLTQDGSGAFITPTVNPGTELKVYGVVNVPANAASTNTGGVNTPLPVTQTATGVTSGIVRTDPNDTLSIAPTGVVAISKSVNASGAQPGGNLVYTVNAVNGFNTAVNNFVLTETNGANTNLFTYTTFAAVGATTTAPGTVLYRFNGGAWQTSPTLPAGLPATSVTRVDVGVDSNGNATMDAGDVLPQGAQINVTFTVTVK